MNDGVGNNSMYYKTKYCTKYMNQGACSWDSKCNYAHSEAELRELPQQQQLCRLFFQNNFCSYGDTCRFLHVNPANPNISHAPHPQQPQLERPDGSSSARWGAMQNSAAAATNVSSRNISSGGQPPVLQKPNDGDSSAAAATDASPSDSLYKYKEDGVVKFIFKNNKLKKINRIYVRASSLGFMCPFVHREEPSLGRLGLEAFFSITVPNHSPSSPETSPTTIKLSPQPRLAATTSRRHHHHPSPIFLLYLSTNSPHRYWRWAPPHPITIASEE
ncbi:hypothetical protein RIF29_28230 [Crotalaria pallida]|uniref:C3H1-type domain-containing protein n=1 Tax=Crotalaria pallida TaxID=3830 RepID=A0AAN9ERB8_CROPI